jgi:hypothetical protein
MSILSITLYTKYIYHQNSETLFERDYSWVFSREQRNNTTSRSGRGSLRSEQESKRDSIMKRELHPAIPLFLTLYLTAGSEALPLTLSYVIVSLLFVLENLLGYLHIIAGLHSPLVALSLPYAEYPVSKHQYTCLLDLTIHLPIHRLLTFVDHM